MCLCACVLYSLSLHSCYVVLNLCGVQIPNFEITSPAPPLSAMATSFSTSLAKFSGILLCVFLCVVCCVLSCVFFFFFLFLLFLSHISFFIAAMAGGSTHPSASPPHSTITVISPGKTPRGTLRLKSVLNNPQKHNQNTKKKKSTNSQHTYSHTHTHPHTFTHSHTTQAVIVDSQSVRGPRGRVRSHNDLSLLQAAASSTTLISTTHTHMNTHEHIHTRLIYRKEGAVR